MLLPSTSLLHIEGRQVQKYITFYREGLPSNSLRERTMAVSECHVGLSPSGRNRLANAICSGSNVHIPELV